MRNAQIQDNCHAHALFREANAEFKNKRIWSAMPKDAMSCGSSSQCGLSDSWTVLSLCHVSLESDSCPPQPWRARSVSSFFRGLSSGSSVRCSRNASRSNSAVCQGRCRRGRPDQLSVLRLVFARALTCKWACVILHFTSAQPSWPASLACLRLTL